MFSMQPIVLINAVGLTPRLLEHAPRLKAIAQTGWLANMPEVFPAVTCTAQATLLTGKMPNEHGVVTNGWHAGAALHMEGTLVDPSTFTIAGTLTIQPGNSAS